MTLQYESFVRKPFMVEAVKVTEENIREISELVGNLKFDENTGAPYIVVDRKKVPNVYRVAPGYWVTKVNNKVRAYAEGSFRAQFTESTPNIEQWVEFMNKPSNEIEDAEEEKEPVA
jgi:hypothetical protein